MFYLSRRLTITNVYEVLIQYEEPTQLLLTVPASSQEEALEKVEKGVMFDYEVVHIEMVAQESSASEEEVTLADDTIPNPTSTTRH